MERNACWARRGKGGAVFVPGNGFLGAAYPHRSSRAGDPQLHTHVLVANATLGPDGRWSRLYHPAIYEHARTAGYIYEAHLRHELTQRLGVEWGPIRKGIADIKGFRPEELARFSTRRAEILAAAGEGASRAELQIATLTTRKAKDRDLTSESLREAWRAKGAEVGLTRETIAARLGHERPGPTVLTAQQIERSVTEHASHFERRDAIRAVAENLPNGAPAAEVEELADAFLASGSVIEIAQTPRGPRYTTERIWRLEQRALAVAGLMQGAQGIAVVDPIIVRRVLDAHPSLKPDQRAMVERLLGDGRALEVVIGEAGTGKTYATAAAASAWSDAGFGVAAAAPTWRAANVLRAEGLSAQTVASLLVRLGAAEEAGRQPLSPRSVLLVDEAGMVDSQSLARLIDHAYRAEAKLVLIGDPVQLGEIEAGGLFAAIARRADPVQLDEVIRHRYELDREAAKLIREGQGSEALGRYAREGRVVVAPDHELRREAIISDWRQAKQRGEDALMIAKLNSERERLNERAREAMRAVGWLGAEEVEVAGRRFAAGDEVITRVNDQRAQIFNRERWRVEAVDVEHERLVLAAIDTNRQVGVDCGYLGRVSPADEAPALEHGYAVTTYQAQGATLDSAYVMADPSMDRQEVERLEDQLATMRESLARAAERREELGEEPPLWARTDRAAYRSEAEQIAWQERYAAEHAAKLEAEIASAPPVEHAARAEQAVAEHLIEQRIGARLAAVRIDPPAYLTGELGERPTDPSKRWAWDRTVSEIERYRSEHGIRDKDSTLGAEPTDSLAQLEHRKAAETLRRRQRQLGLEQPGQARAVEQTRGLGIEM